MLECAIEEYGLRTQTCKLEPILEEDIKKAADFLLEQREISPKRRSIGFGGK